ncbi:MAG: thioesterase family protein [Chloroflexi bacterium]|nr:thioesterase family protein [Chloroflexota bacterium]
MPTTQASLNDIRQLEKMHQQRIPSAFMDENSHMNVQYYVHVAEQGLSEFLRRVGMGEFYAVADKFGNFALEQHIRYYAEILTGDQVSVHVRLIDVSPKRCYMMGFLINDTREQLAATVEVVMMNIDMVRRRGAPFPDEAKVALDSLHAQHCGLGWEAPVCGVMRA